MNPGDRDCSEPRSHHCTLAWPIEQDSVLKEEREKEKREREREKERKKRKEKEKERKD